MVALLADDAWLTMPPYPFEYQGKRDHHATSLGQVELRQTTRAVARAKMLSTYRNDCRPGNRDRVPKLSSSYGTRWSSMNRNCTNL